MQTEKQVKPKNLLDFALACKYIDEQTYQQLYEQYNQILSMLTSMTVNSDKWTFDSKKK